LLAAGGALREIIALVFSGIEIVADDIIEIEFFVVIVVARIIRIRPGRTESGSPPTVSVFGGIFAHNVERRLVNISYHKIEYKYREWNEINR